MEKSEPINWPAWGIGSIAWLIPGAGHLLQGKWLRGVILGGVVWTLFIIGKLWGGHFYPLLGSGEPASAYLDVFWSVMNFGTGAIYLFSYFTGANFTEQAQLLTFEYGDTFLKVAGLLNFLVMLDAFDIRVGRKP